MSAPLVLGTAGHVDHGKTTLVQALTGTWADRLPEERARGLTIALGYALLELPSGRRLSVVDVPGHERFVRTMVAGATGIDLFLLVVAADDGVMPQTLEHLAVLRALGVRDGVVAITKADVADPGRAAEEVRELLGDAEIVACDARAGTGRDALVAALDRVAATLTPRAGRPGPPVLHVDRSFTVDGRGAVVTGTLWSGTLHEGDRLAVLPGGTDARVRGLEVHGAPVATADAGQRVAVNLAGVRSRDVARGDVLSADDAVVATTVLDCRLDVQDAEHGQRVQVHHGTRHSAARMAHLREDLWQLRLEAPVLARDGDHVVIRRHAPPDTLGGGVVLDAAAGRHGPAAPATERLVRLRDGLPEPEPEVEVEPAPEPVAPAPAPLSPAATELLERLREAGVTLLSEAQIDDADALRALRDAALAVRVSGRLYAHVDAVAEVRGRVIALLAERGSLSLAELRDDLGASRKSAQAFLELLDREHVTRRGADDRRTLASRTVPTS
jgi:selenocysteine-specific elongation factor